MAIKHSHSAILNIGSGAGNATRSIEHTQS